MVMNITDARLRWPSLAQDLAIFYAPNSPVERIEDVCEAYNITQDELREILKIPYFRSLFDAAMQDVKEQGPKAGLRYRALMLSQGLIELLYRKANVGAMEDKDMLKFLDNLLKASGVEREAATQVNVQNNIALPFPQGVKKVEQFVKAVE